MQYITAEELKQNMDDFLLVDIRGERRSIPQRIEGCTIIDVYEDIHFGNFEIAKQKLSTLPKDKKIVLICNTGSTTQPACTIMEQMGYDVVNLENGMMAWNSIS